MICSTLPKRNVINPIASEMESLVLELVFVFVLLTGTFGVELFVGMFRLLCVC